MKSIIAVVFVLGCVSFVSGCGGCAEAAKSPPLPPNRQGGVPVFDANVPSVRISSGDVRRTSHPGWPIVFDVTVVHPGATDPSTSTPPITLGAWRDALVVRVVGSDGRALSWPFEQIGGGQELAVLSATTPVAHVRLRLPAEKTQAIEPGTYQLVAELNGWTSDALELELIPEPLSSQLLAAQKHREFAEHLEALGDAPGALVEAEAAVTALPTDPDARALKARLLLATKQYAAALALFEELIEEEHARYPNAIDPPFDLLDGRNKALRGMIGMTPP